MEDDVAPPLPTLEPISRPSSASTTESQAVAQLPSIAALATGSVTSSPQPRATNAPTAVMSSATSPGATVPLASGGMPTCMNCQTSTTPLWRRDEMGAVLCNACGLFLKLHGRPRPISLKTDVIKSRNRVKTMRPDMQMKKKQSLPAATAPVNHNGMMQAHDTTSTALAAVQRATQGKTNGHGADENSPGSRNGTPSMYDPHLPVFQGMDPNQFQSSSMPRYPMPGGSPGQPGSPSNGDPTQEQLISENAGLKTRVSELDLINELYRSRLTQLEHDSQTQDNYRHQAEVATKNEAHERAMREEIQRDFERTHRQLEESHRRENILKRRLDEMEQELKDVHDRLDQFEHLGHADSDRPSKRPRLDPDLLKDESTAMADMIDGAITGEAGVPAHVDAPDQDGDDKVGQLEQVHQVDQVPEVEQHSQAEQLPEAEQLSKSDQLPEADQLPKADAIPEAEQIPEPEHDPESERILEAEHMPDVEHPDVEHLPVVEHLPEAGYIPEHIPEAEHNPQAEQTTEVGQLPQNGQMTEAEPLPQADPMHPAEHILADDHVDNMEQAEHLNNHVDGHIDQVDEPMDLSALQQD